MMMMATTVLLDRAILVSPPFIAGAVDEDAEAVAVEDRMAVERVVGVEPGDAFSVVQSSSVPWP
jgi:hypothetical protein